MADLPTLLERVKGAEGPDRELDADIEVALRGGEIVQLQNRFTGEPLIGIRRPSTNHYGGFVNDPCPPLTCSIDAALSLVEAKVPGWSWRIGNTLSRPNDVMHGGAFCLLGTSSRDVEAATAPLAILAALLTALISHTKTGEQA